MIEILNPEKKIHKILIVDDEETTLKYIHKRLKKSIKCNIINATNGHEALDMALAHLPDIILLDIIMPEMNGFDVLKKLKENVSTKFIPVIIITGLETTEDRIKAIKAGANDFITKPIIIDELLLRVENTLKLKEYQNLLKTHNTMLEDQVKKRTNELYFSFKNLDETSKKLKSSYIETIYRLALVAEYRDEDTGAHIMRISYYCEELAKKMDMDKEFIENIFYASSMHDIGKVGIPDNILLKPGKFEKEEWEIMKTHATLGGKILSGSDSPLLKMAEKIAMTHHERWDGGGYPKGLKGDEIPISGLIMNIADQYDALRSLRPYKKSFSHRETLDIILKGDGRTMPNHFSPDVLSVFKLLTDRFNEIFEEFKEGDIAFEKWKTDL